MSKSIKLSTPGVAREFHFRMPKYSKHTIIMGCDGLFWIVTNKEAIKLIRNGYEELPKD